MKNRVASFAGLVVTVVSVLGSPSRAAAQQGQVVKLGEGISLTISGFVNATFFWDRNLFGAFGNGQNAEIANPPSAYPRGKIINDGDVRNTRINFTFAGPAVMDKWTPKATIEADFFGAFTTAPAPPYGDEQPQFRIRHAYVDLTNGKTTIRIGQYWAPLFGETAVSLVHIAFPPGLGSAGDVGWRFPGIFVYTDLSPNVQLQLAALKGSGPVVGLAGANGEGTGEASGKPQLEARLNFARRSANLAWSVYAVGHIDWKDTTGNSSGPDLTSNAFEVGGSVAPGKFLLHGNFYTGRAMGQQFGMITQQGDIHGYGGWAQAGYDLTTHWSAFAFYGFDQPDAQRFLAEGHGNLARQLNHDAAALLRFRAGRYQVGLEYFRAVTKYSGATPQSADQFAISTLFVL